MPEKMGARSAGYKAGRDESDCNQLPAGNADEKTAVFHSSTAEL